jgi:hypothetical protein
MRRSMRRKRTRRRKSRGRRRRRRIWKKSVGRSLTLPFVQ